MKSRKRFGGALEPATQVRAHYTERPRQDLVRLDQFEILWSPLTAPVDISASPASSSSPKSSKKPCPTRPLRTTSTASPSPS